MTTRGTIDVIVIVDVIVDVIGPRDRGRAPAVHLNGNATVIVIRPVDGSHATVALSAR